MAAHSSPTIPDAASSNKSSVKDTLFLSKAESEWMVGGRAPQRDRVLVERVGELGQRKIPGLRLTDRFPSIQQTQIER